MESCGIVSDHLRNCLEVGGDTIDSADTASPSGMSSI